MTQKRVLIAGVGNIFLGDDAFGVEVVRLLGQRPQTPGVRVVDFGIRGMDLAYALMDGYDAAILVDAAPRGEPPGTLFVIEPDTAAGTGAPPSPQDLLASGPVLPMHNMDPATVLRLVAALGGQVGRLLVVGCEPTPMESEEEMAMGISPPVQAALPEAVKLVESLVAQIIAGTAPVAAAQGPPGHKPVHRDTPSVTQAGPG